MVFELVYTSLASGQGLDDQGLNAILQVSRLRNLELKITGALFYERGEFVQLLEGEEAAVRSLYYGKIALDPRHRTPYVCWEQAKEARTFPDWQMGFVPADPDFPLPRDGLLKNGIKSLDLSGRRSIGRDLYLNIVADMQNPRRAGEG